MEELNHKLSVSERKAVTVTGVREVVSFDAREVTLDTTLGILLIRGEQMQMKRLVIEKGEADIEGQIDSLIYSEKGIHRKKNGESLLKQMFH